MCEVSFLIILVDFGTLDVQGKFALNLPINSGRLQKRLTAFIIFSTSVRWLLLKKLIFLATLTLFSTSMLVGGRLLGTLGLLLFGYLSGSPSHPNIS